MIRSMKASGNIAPARFVKITTSADGQVTQAGAGDKVFGVSQKGTRRIPYSTLDDGYAAIAGEDLLCYGLGERPMLEIAGTVTPGMRLKSDADGKGVAVASNNDEYGAIAMVAGTAGQLIQVEVMPHSQFGA